MFKKGISHLTSNMGIKILSVLFAVVLWLAVNNYDNPDITRTFRVPVATTEEQVLINMGKAYTIDPDTSVAIVSVTGPRKTVDDFQTSDFKATADLSQLSSYEDGVQTTDIVVEPSNTTVQEKIAKDNCELKLNKLVGGKEQKLKVTLEPRTDEQTYVVGETTGTPAEGYAIGDMYVSPNLVKVSGPMSVVSKIAKIAAPVNVDNLTADCSVDASLVMYDAEGNVIENSKITLTPSVVTVKIQILGTKTVPVECQTTGTPAEGYVFVELEYAPKVVVIKGSPFVLNNIDKIAIPEETIDLTGATADVENSIDITPYLSEAGVSLVKPEENKIAVKAVIERLETKQLELPVSALTVENLSDNYEVSYGAVSVPVTVRGRSGDIAALANGHLKGTINLRNLQPGTYTVVVEVELDEKYQVLGELTLQLTIAEKGSETPDHSGTGGTETGGTENP